MEELEEEEEEEAGKSSPAKPAGEANVVVAAEAEGERRFSMLEVKEVDSDEGKMDFEGWGGTLGELAPA